jgi:transcriptional regulator with XRE-family HTH domain
MEELMAASSTNAETIGRRLKRLRLERGLSQRELSSPGVSYAYISRIEAGTRQPSVKALRMLARKLEVSVEYLETGREVGDEAQREMRLADAELRLRLEPDGEKAAAELTALLGEATQAGDRLVAMRAHSALGFAAFGAGRAQEAISHLESALETLPPAPEARPDVYATLGQAYALAGRPDRAVQLFRDCLHRLSGEEPLDPSTQVRFATYLSYALSDLGDLAGAQAAVKEALGYARSDADPYTRVRLYWSLARLADIEGNGVSALSYIRKAIALLESTDDTLHLARAHLAAARLLMLPGGDLERAGQELEIAAQLYGPRIEAFDLASMRTEQARLAAKSGDAGAAIELAREAIEGLGDTSPGDQGHAWWALAEGQALKGDVDEADAAFRRAAELLAQHGHARDRVEVHRAWGRALAAAGREAAAAAAFERAER